MGMFDKKQYLTGKDGLVKAGDTFFIHDAAEAGMGTNGPEASMVVSRERESARKTVFVGGNMAMQIRQMDADDKASFPVQVRLDNVDTGKGNAAYVLTPADQPEPGGAAEF